MLGDRPIFIFQVPLGYMLLFSRQSRNRARHFFCPIFHAPARLTYILPRRDMIQIGVDSSLGYISQSRLAVLIGFTCHARQFIMSRSEFSRSRSVSLG
jgi:hypothetical protein